VNVAIDVRDLLSRPGSSRTIHVEERIGGLSTELAEVPADRSVEADLLMESVVEGVLASGPVEGAIVYSCARCLRPFEGAFRVEVQELFAAGAPEEAEEYRIEEGFVDLEPMIRDAVLTSVPFAPLCSPDCHGMCARCGADLNVGACRCAPEPDARWDALSNIRFEVAERRGTGEE